MQWQYCFMTRKALNIKERGKSKNSENCQVGLKGHNKPPSWNSQGLQNMERICKCSQNLEKQTASDKLSKQVWKCETALTYKINSIYMPHYTCIPEN